MTQSTIKAPIKGKWLLAAAVCGLLAAGSVEILRGGDGQAAPVAVDGLAAMAPASGDRMSGYPAIEGFAGKFLASHFAQYSYDWEKAAQYLNEVIALDPDNFDLIKRAMVLAMGTGDTATASARAQELLALEPDNGFALLVVAVHDIAQDDMAHAVETLRQMPEGDMTAFVKPLLLGWAEAGRGELTLEAMAPAPLHMYHSALMALYLGEKDEARQLTEQMLAIKGLTAGEATRVADMLAALGDKEKALGVYQGMRLQDSSDPFIDRKIAALESGDAQVMEDAIPPLQIKSPQKGAALALYDMAFILFQEDSDSSTKLFAQMALAIDPQLTEAHLLLAEMMIRNDRPEEAVAILQEVPADHAAYLESQRRAAELLAGADRQDEALVLLNDLYKNHDDVESLIRIGDIYRHQENYDEALKAYNRAAKALDNEVPEAYWHLLYARGMVHEREGNWKQAVEDLRAAIAYRPNHPYLLNYLGYGWADKGENLDESLEMIRRAVSLRPMDGYIVDSLGWVLYRMGQYEEAVPHLERAVELLPYDPTINDHLGDAYWQVGRHLEARFQWRRAINNSEDNAEIATIESKLREGLVLKKADMKKADQAADVRAASNSTAAE